MNATLYVSHSKRGALHYYLDASTRYRCVFPCEFEEEGQIKHCIHFDQLDKIDFNNYQRIIFHRPFYNWKLKRIVKNLNRLNIKVIVDFDDLLFSPEYALQNPTYLSGKMTALHAKKSAYKYLKALRLFKLAQTSTDYLKQHVKLVHPECIVETHYNKLPERWTKLTPIVATEERLQNKIIRYFPGTSHHTSNFESSIDTLKNILKNNKDIKLEVIGDIKILPNTFPTNQFSQHSPVMFEELPTLIANSWLTISPLESNEFNQCKSGLKFWESACFGVPVISNPIPDMERFHCEGLQLSNNHRDWIASINSMKDKSYYQQACDSALKLALTCVLKSKEQEQCDYESIQLLMSAEFGPSWPAIRVNPTHEHFTHSNRLHESFLKMQESTLKEMVNTSDALRKSPTNAKTYLTSVKKSTAKRKLKKLKNNPRLFFKDMIAKAMR